MSDDIQRWRVIKDEADRAQHEAWQLWSSLKRLNENLGSGVPVLLDENARLRERIRITQLIVVLKERAGLRGYIVANMMDGDDGGRITMDANVLADEIVEIAGYWLDDLLTISAPPPSSKEET